MDTDLLFFFGCLPVRTILALNIDKLPRFMLALGSIGFSARSILENPKEVNVGLFGSKVWWHNMRYAHSLLWAWAYFHSEQAKNILLLDVGLSLFAKSGVRR
jgi:hypothetical protein